VYWINTVFHHSCLCLYWWLSDCVIWMPMLSESSFLDYDGYLIAWFECHRVFVVLTVVR
jgi:hypothetical protein